MRCSYQSVDLHADARLGSLCDALNFSGLDMDAHALPLKEEKEDTLSGTLSRNRVSSFAVAHRQAGGGLVQPLLEVGE